MEGGREGGREGREEGRGVGKGKRDGEVEGIEGRGKANTCNNKTSKSIKC